MSPGPLPLCLFCGGCLCLFLFQSLFLSPFYCSLLPLSFSPIFFLSSPLSSSRFFPCLSQVSFFPSQSLSHSCFCLSLSFISHSYSCTPFPRPIGETVLSPEAWQVINDVVESVSVLQLQDDAVSSTLPCGSSRVDQERNKGLVKKQTSKSVGVIICTRPHREKKGWQGIQHSLWPLISFFFQPKILWVSR